MTADLSSTYFISDLHLDPSRPELTQAFHHFLFQTAKSANEIYILGDFFDSWIGDDHNSKLIKQVKSWLTEKSAQGPKIYFQHGNRDFLIGEKFAESTNVILLQEAHVIDLYGVNFLLLHGDQLCSDDIDYQAFRQKVRNPAWQKRVLSYPLWVRKLIATYFRHRSRKAHKMKPAEIMDVTPSTVDAFFNEYNVQHMLHGHTHRPAIHEVRTGESSCRRYVLGDWGNKGWYIKADPSSIELIEFPIP